MPAPCKFNVLKATALCFSDRYYYGNCNSARCCNLFEFYNTDDDYCYYNASSSIRSEVSSSTTSCTHILNGVCYSNWYYSPYEAGCPITATYWYQYCYYGASAITKTRTTTTTTRTTISTTLATSSTMVTAKPCYQVALSMCFTNRTDSRLYSVCNHGVSYDGSGTVCCRSDEYFYDADNRCYSGYVGGELTTSALCPYIAFGVCYDNRYYHGPCLYDGCCRSTYVYYNSSCYYNVSATNLSCSYTVNGVCYNTCKYYGPCALSRCCAIDETYYNGFCYHYGVSRVRTVDPVSYQLNQVFYSGRKYTGSCESGNAFDVFKCCTNAVKASVFQYFNKHCYFLTIYF